MENSYFTFYDLEPKFSLDEVALKSKYYALSRSLHPDFYTMASPEKQEEVLLQSSYNNQAYLTLSDFHKRMYYILELHGLIEEGGNDALDQDFLMDMMDINEQVMEIQLEGDQTGLGELLTTINNLESSLLKGVETNMTTFDSGETNTENLKKIKEYYLKRKYLLRIKENISNFAGL